MKALAKTKPEKGIWMIDAPKPTVGHNDVLIKIKKTAICGTDIHIYKWDEWAQNKIPVPLIIGHEFVGEVVHECSHFFARDLFEFSGKHFACFVVVINLVEFFVVFD